MASVQRGRRACAAADARAPIGRPLARGAPAWLALRRSPSPARWRAAVARAGGGRARPPAAAARRTRVVRAQVTPAGASASLSSATGTRELNIADMPQLPPSACMRCGSNARARPQPTDALFTVTRRAARRCVPGGLNGARRSWSPPSRSAAAAADEHAGDRRAPVLATASAPGVCRTAPAHAGGTPRGGGDDQAQLVPARAHAVAGSQLAPAAVLGLAVDERRLGGEQRLDSLPLSTTPASFSSCPSRIVSPADRDLDGHRRESRR